jgi:hypothetical protein
LELYPHLRAAIEGQFNGHLARMARDQEQYQIWIMRTYTQRCHCEERSDEAISALRFTRHEIASLRSQ